MAVEANEGGGNGVGEELLARAYEDMEKEKGVGGEKVSITCRDDDDNDGSGTDGSFVMVMADVDLSERSDSSENDTNMGSAVPAGRDLLDTKSDLMSFIDDAMIEKGAQKILGDSLSAENEVIDDDTCIGEVANKLIAVPVDPAQAIKESVKTDLEQKGEIKVVLKDLKDDEEERKTNEMEMGLEAEDQVDEKGAFIEEVDDTQVVADCESLKNEEGAIMEHLSNEDEAIVGEDLENEIDEEEESNENLEDLNDEASDNKDLIKEGKSGVKEEFQILEDFEKKCFTKEDKTKLTNGKDLENLKNEAMEDKDLNIRETKVVIVKVVEKDLTIEYVLDKATNGEDSKKEDDDEVVSREDSEKLKDDAMEDGDLNREEQSLAEEKVVIVNALEKMVAVENSKEVELIKGTKIAFEGPEASYEENNLGSNDDKSIIEAFLAQSSSSAHDKNFELELSVGKREAVEYIYDSEKPQKGSEQQAGDALFSFTDKKEPPFYCDLEETRDDNLEIANEKISADFNIEDKKYGNHNDCEDPTKIELDPNSEIKEIKKIDVEELRIDAGSKIIDYLGEKADYVSHPKVTDHSPICTDLETKDSPVIQMHENSQTFVIDLIKEHREIKNNDLSIKDENAKFLSSANLESKEDMNFALEIEEQNNLDSSVIDRKLEPITKHLALASEEILVANPSSIDIISAEDIISVSKSEETLAAEKRELKSVTEELKSGTATVVIEDQNNELKSEITNLHAKKYRMIRIPRFFHRAMNAELQAKITDAQVQVIEHTKNRDSLKVELDGMRKALSDCFHKREFASEEEKKAKAHLNAKRLEMDSFQNVISKGKAASFFLDIAAQIQALEHKMQHETISLKDEKKCLHELHQLKQEQEHDLFNKCSQHEIDDAIKQKDLTEFSMRAMKRELDILRSAHLKADECLKTAGKNYVDQYNKVKDQEKRWKAANELRQNAYKSFHGLKSDKMEHYWKYMEDRQAANKYASSRDFESLEQHCAHQVERIMCLWNEDNDFRRHYVESNAGNTLRKFGTSDGRTLGPNDTTSLLPRHDSQIPVTVRDELPILACETSRPAPPAIQKEKVSLFAFNDDVVSLREKFVEEKHTKEEEEQDRKEEEKAKREEELRREREAIELKQKLRMEQKVKAKEAEERKKRKIEKAQARAEYKAQREAEVRELKRAKKQMKKEIVPENSRSVESEPASSNETAAMEESGDRMSSRTLKKRSAAALNKYSCKAQAVPLPLRNRGKRKMMPWLWTLLAATVLACLFFAGNYVSFSVSWANFGF